MSQDVAPLVDEILAKIAKAMRLLRQAGLPKTAWQTIIDDPEIRRRLAAAYKEIETPKLALDNEQLRVMIQTESAAHRAALEAKKPNFLGIPEVTQVLGHLTTDQLAALQRIPFTEAVMKASPSSFLYVDPGFSIIETTRRIWEHADRTFLPQKVLSHGDFIGADADLLKAVDKPKWRLLEVFDQPQMRQGDTVADTRTAFFAAAVWFVRTQDPLFCKILTDDTRKTTVAAILKGRRERNIMVGKGDSRELMDELKKSQARQGHRTLSISETGRSPSLSIGWINARDPWFTDSQFLLETQPNQD